MGDMDRAGLVKVSINGSRMDISAEGINYAFGSPKRTEILAGDGRMVGFSGEGIAPFIEFKVIDHAKLDTEALLGITDATATATLFNGKTVVLSNASNTSDKIVQSSDGTFTVRLVGTSLKEI